MKVSELRKRLDPSLVAFSTLEKVIEREETALKEAKEHLEHCKIAQLVVQEVAQKVQQTAHKRIASVVTKCLQTVFGDTYEFRILFEKKRGKTEARLVFVKNEEKYHPIDASGGGVIDVASFALRLSCLMLSQPRKRRFLCLDEPMKHLNGEEVQERVGELIMTLAREMKIQMLIVSDDEWLQIGKVVRI